MLLPVLLICVAYLLLQAVRLGFFHTHLFAIHDPIFNYRQPEDSRLYFYAEVALCNLAFLAICALTGLVTKAAFSCSRESILLGVGLGAFLMVWPAVYTYRLYAFWANPVAAVCLLYNALEVVYAVGFTDFCLTGNPWELFVLVIPAVCIVLRRRLHKKHSPAVEEMTLQTKYFVVLKKMKLRQQPFEKKYGAYIREAAEEFRLPPNFLSRFILLQQICHGAWNYRLEKWLILHLTPFASVKNRLSIGLGMLKPATVEEYFGGITKETYRKLQDPKENTRVTAWYLRKLIEQYPGAGNYLFGAHLDLPCDKPEYEALDETGQLVHYLVSLYTSGIVSSRMDYVTIITDILLQSDAEKLTNGK